MFYKTLFVLKISMTFFAMNYVVKVFFVICLLSKNFKFFKRKKAIGSFVNLKFFTALQIYKISILFFYS